MSDRPNIFTSIGIVRLLRYGCGGFLLAVFLSFTTGEVRERVKSAVDSLGVVLTVSGAFVVGAVNYVFVRHVLGVFLIYPTLHLVHRGWDRWRGRTTQETATSCLSLMEKLGVQFGDRNAACGTVRAKFFDEHDREHYNIVRSELHMLWIAAIDLLAVALFAGMGWKWYLASALFASCAIVADISQSMVECGRLQSNREEVKTILQGSGYFSSESKSGEPKEGGSAAPSTAT